MANLRHPVQPVGQVALHLEDEYGHEETISPATLDQLALNSRKIDIQGLGLLKNRRKLSAELATGQQVAMIFDVRRFYGMTLYWLYEADVHGVWRVPNLSPQVSGCEEVRFQGSEEYRQDAARDVLFRAICQELGHAEQRINLPFDDVLVVPRKLSLDPDDDVDEFNYRPLLMRGCELDWRMEEFKQDGALSLCEFLESVR